MTPIQLAESGRIPDPLIRLGIRRMLAGLADDLGIGFGWGALYFTTFLVLGRGQTPGKRLLGIRVIRLDGKPVGRTPLRLRITSRSLPLVLTFHKDGYNAERRVLRRGELPEGVSVTLRRDTTGWQDPFENAAPVGRKAKPSS